MKDRKILFYIVIAIILQLTASNFTDRKSSVTDTNVSRIDLLYVLHDLNFLQDCRIVNVSNVAYNGKECYLHCKFEYNSLHKEGMKKMKAVLRNANWTQVNNITKNIILKKDAFTIVISPSNSTAIGSSDESYTLILKKSIVDE